MAHQVLLIAIACNRIMGVAFDLIMLVFFIFFFFNDTATTEIYTLSLHDALPIWGRRGRHGPGNTGAERHLAGISGTRSEEHTSELQSQSNLVCRLLLEKKKNNTVDIQVN